MGASIGMASGISHAGVRPVMCVIGDSTFTHSGITPLLDAARENTDMNVFILDNGIVAMTGGQPPMAQEEELAQLVEGLGVPRAHIRTLSPIPKNHEENVRIIREEVNHAGLSVIIFKRECVTYLQTIRAIHRGKEERNA